MTELEIFKDVKPADGNEDLHSFADKTAGEGPGQLYHPFVLMEELVEKLKLLKYDIHFCRELHQKPISRHYFAIVTNSGEQFNCFSVLAAWLIQLCGRKMETPQEITKQLIETKIFLTFVPNANLRLHSADLFLIKSTSKMFKESVNKFKPHPLLTSSSVTRGFQKSTYTVFGKRKILIKMADDPNAVIATVLHNLRALGLKPDFPPNKLKSGSGQFCIWVLHQLADEALKAKHFSFKLPEYPAEENILEDFEEEEPDLLHLSGTENLEEDQLQEAEDCDDEEHVLGLDEIKVFGSLVKADVDEKKVEEIMESTTDVAEWKLEVERVLPQLKIAARSDNKDWRVHLEHINQYHSNIEAVAKDIKMMLSRLNDEIVASMEKIGSREKYINQQLRNSLTLLAQTRNALAEIKEIYRQASSGVAEKTRQLAELSDELDHVKQEMEERGTRMTDGSQLVKIRQAIAKAQEENNQMDIRIGVLQHILLRYTLKTHKRFDADNADKFLVY